MMLEAPAEDKRPLIVNLDSRFDWTTELRQIWERIDWDGIRQRISPQIPSESWLGRRNQVGLVALVSSLVIDDCYHLPQWANTQEGAEKDEDPLCRDWREPQLGRRERQDSQRSHFSGEEPFFRSPRVATAGVVECYGICVEAATSILSSCGLLDKVPACLHQAPAIFLCPERIHDIYPTVVRLGENLRHTLPLSLNPALVNFSMTLLHELGHHFFPVHRSGAGRFLGEGLANLFGYHALDQQRQAWLLYKSWHLQPPEYSAYRPLTLLCDSDVDFRSAVAACFSGDLSGWARLPKKDPLAFERALGAGLTMALAADAAACKGLWWDELRKIVSDENRLFLRWDDGHMHFHVNRHGDGNIPADFVLDLYRQSDLADWASVADFPSRLWGRWAYGDEVRWPHDCITVAEAELGRWLVYYAASQDTPLASVICEKLVSLLHASPHAVNQPGLGPALDHALAVATDRQGLWFDRVPAIQLIETCADTGSFPASDARWMFANFTVELESVAAEQDYGDVHDAALKAVASLRAAALKHWNGDTTG
jgi:hypothetical protein